MIEFRSSHAELDGRGFLNFENFESNVVFKDIDFGKAVDENNIEYREDGVYLNFKGYWLRGYYFMKDYSTVKFNKLPVMHLYNCKVMQDKHLFIGKYIWSNAALNDVFCRDQEEWLHEKELKLCYWCDQLLKEKVSNTISNSREFYEDTDQLSIDEILKNHASIINDGRNIKGYPFNWRSVASKFKEKIGLVCNRCGITKQDQMERKYFDVDHIEGYRKDVYDDSNLQVLCKLCHVFKDEHHQEQAIKYPNRNKLLFEFVNNNREELNQKCSNYLYEFDKLFLNVS